VSLACWSFPDAEDRKNSDEFGNAKRFAASVSIVGRDVSSVLAVQPDALPRKEHIIWEPPMREETRSKHVEPSYRAAPKTCD
jgi:hypothetical protein